MAPMWEFSDVIYVDPKILKYSYRLYSNAQRFSESTDLEKRQEDTHTISNR